MQKGWKGRKQGSICYLDVCIRGMAVLLSFDELRDLYGMTNIRPDQRRQIEFLLETAEEEVLAYSDVNLEGEFDLGSINYAYRYNDDNSITSIPCDGVEVEKYSGGLDRVDKDFFFSVQDGEGFVSNLNSLREAIRVLARINFDTEMLFYVSSW